MRIILSEMLGEQPIASREFNQASIKIGRDPQECHLVFDQAKWQMVSRTHANVRFQDGRCYLIDLNSKQGTFLNGQKIVAPSEIQVGARIQFGQSGPVLRVDLIESGGERAGFTTVVMETPPPASRVDPQFTPHTTAGVRSSIASRRLDTPVLVLENGTATGAQRQFSIESETTVLGRDATADIQVQGDAPVVSRRHAEIRRERDGTFLIVDLHSFNGTLVNGQRINQPTAIRDGDRIQLSVGGPVLRFTIPASSLVQTGKPSGAPSAANAFAAPPSSVVDVSESARLGQTTMVFAPGSLQSTKVQEGAQAQFLLQVGFEGKQYVSVGRAPDNDIQLDALLISNHHARFIRKDRGVVVQDTRSTNGVHVNGQRIAGWQPVQENDLVQIGPFLLTANAASGVAVFDTRSQVRVDAVDLTDVVSRPAGAGTLKLLDEISLAIDPNEFVGLLGPSGAGKSVLMNTLNGMRRASTGRVLINNLDLHQHLHSLKQSIGHVPQDDIIHRELTAYRTLYYVARLRLSSDVPRQEIDQIINEVLEVTGLSDRRDLPIAQLSGGQRKRVSIAVELITRPSIIFLDEPTSGLDPATESRIMKLFRQIAESGRTVVLTTHAMENVQLFDKIAVLMRGKLIFFGPPDEALAFAGVEDFIDLYTKLEQPLEVEIARLPPLPPNPTEAERRAHEERRNEIAERVAEEWRNRYRRTPAYRRYLADPLSELHDGRPATQAVAQRAGIIDSLRQWITLVRRYTQVLWSDKLNLLILFGQAPIIGVLTFLVVSQQVPRDFPYFVLALVPLWFGTSVAAREIVKERSIFRRERMVNLRLIPYVGSKLFALSCIVSLQCFMLLATLKALHYPGLMYLPGLLGGVGQLAVMILTGVVGIAIGLFVSALVRTSEIATSIVPLILIPQILFCGLVGVPEGVSRVVGAAMPATWSFDEMKRLSTLDTLREEGSNPEGENRGRGLFKSIEEENERNIAETRRQLENYQRDSENSLKEYEGKLNEYLTAGKDARGAPVGRAPTVPVIQPPPSIPEARKLPDDLTNYITFKHPWGGLALNPAILTLMAFGLIVMTIISLRAKDPG